MVAIVREVWETVHVNLCELVECLWISRTVFGWSVVASAFDHQREPE